MAKLPKIGAHVDQVDPLGAAAELGADCVQIFLGKPSGWEKPPEREDAEELRSSPVDLYVHAQYRINVCSPQNNIRYGARKMLQQQCDAAAAIGAKALIVHPGHAEDGIPAGVDRWRRTLEMTKSEVPDLSREHRRRRQRRRAQGGCARAALGGGPVGRHRDRGRLLLRHLPRARRRRGPDRRGRPDARDHRPSRPGPRERLTRPGRHRSRPPRQPRRGADRPRRTCAR